jgi:hypothetical protein
MVLRALCVFGLLSVACGGGDDDGKQKRDASTGAECLDPESEVGATRGMALPGDTELLENALQGCVYSGIDRAACDGSQVLSRAQVLCLAASVVDETAVEPQRVIIRFAIAAERIVWEIETDTGDAGHLYYTLDAITGEFLQRGASSRLE